jgi:putative methyltransferase (TIGR04325 family)
MVKFKNYLKNILPPFIFKIITTIILSFKVNKGIRWKGEFKTWEDALLISEGYDNNIILNNCKNSLLKVKNNEAVYERDSVIFDQVQYPWALLSSLLSIASEYSSTLIVLDFGGSLGSSYYQNKYFLKSLQKIKWCIVEQKNFVECGKIHFQNDTLNFFYNIEECLEENKPNVLLLSSVLQYLENPKEFLNKVKENLIPYILIDRTPFIKSDNLITLQYVGRDIYNASYPCHFFTNNFIDSILDTNYEKVIEFPSFCDKSIYFNNKKVIWSGALYKKRE